MRHIKIIKPISLIILLFLITSCSNNSTMKPEDFKNKEPRLIIEEYFKKEKKGHISIVSSIAGYRGLPNSSGYGPSKAALTNFAESIYFDFKKHNVKVSVVSPGFIKTPLTDKNEFPMPFLRSPEFAANKVYDGLVKTNSFEIDFPKQLTFTLKFFRILPYKIYLFLVDKLVKR